MMDIFQWTIVGGVIGAVAWFAGVAYCYFRDRRRGVIP